MARLALVRKRREEAEARKAEEAAAEGASGKAKMEKEAKAKAGSGGPQKLNPLEVQRRQQTFERNFWCSYLFKPAPVSCFWCAILLMVWISCTILPMHSMCMVAGKMFDAVV